MTGRTRFLPIPRPKVFSSWALDGPNMFGSEVQKLGKMAGVNFRFAESISGVHFRHSQGGRSHFLTRFGFITLKGKSGKLTPRTAHGNARTSA